MFDIFEILRNLAYICWHLRQNMPKCGAKTLSPTGNRLLPLRGTHSHRSLTILSYFLFKCSFTIITINSTLLIFSGFNFSRIFCCCY